MTQPSRSIDTLLSEARWLERLARELVSDREEARDLVQEVWVAAAARAPENVERPRAWLATVLRNALSMRGRGAAARVERERSRASRVAGVAAAAEEVVARAEAQRVLVESVLGLEEPWRSTVLWHHFDGESCESIAHRTRTNASTVRNRLAEARSRLRERLERRRADWFSALLPLAASPGGASAVQLSSVLGWSIMSTSLKLSAAAAAIVLGVWWIASTPETEPELEYDRAVAKVEVTPEPAPMGVAPEPDEERRSASAPVGEHETQPAAVLVPPGPGEILVRVTEDGRPYTGGGTARLGEAHLEGLPAPRELPLAADGTARFTNVPAKRAVYVIDHMVEVVIAEGHRVRSPLMRLTEGEGRECTLRVGSARIFGTVWDELGGPAAGERISISCGTALATNHVTGVDCTLTAVTDSTGSYAVERVPAGPCRVYLSMRDRSNPGKIAREENPILELRAGESRRLDFGAPNGWPAWTGRVLAGTGTPPMDVVWVRVLRNAGRPESYAIQRCGRDGSFELHVPPGEHKVEVRRDLDWDVVHEFKDVVVGPNGLAQDLVLPGTRLSGRVFASDGAFPGAGIAGLTISARIEDEDWPSAFETWRVAEDGSFAVDALAPGTYVLVTYPFELAPESAALRITIGAGDLEVRADLRLAPR